MDNPKLVSSDPLYENRSLRFGGKERFCLLPIFEPLCFLTSISNVQVPFSRKLVPPSLSSRLFLNEMHLTHFLQYASELLLDSQ